MHWRERNGRQDEAPAIEKDCGGLGAWTGISQLVGEERLEIGFGLIIASVLLGAGYLFVGRVFFFPLRPPSTPSSCLLFLGYRDSTV